MGGTVSDEEKNAAEIHAEGGTVVVCEGQGATERIDSVASRENAESRGTGLGVLLWRRAWITFRLNNGQPARAELAAPAFAGLTLEKSELSPSAMVG